MKKEVSFSIDSDVYEKFCLALHLTNEEEDEAVETCLRNYIARTFERASHEYNPNSTKKTVTDPDRDFYGKAIQRIPVWAIKPNQYNHKIIRAFFEAEQATGEVTIDNMELLCSDKERSELYVPTFKNNYAQMKLDGPKTHGKVFEDDGEHVWIWKEVEEILRRHKSSFLL